jgi:poly(beta-D-mannuronate) lyase
MIRLLVLTSLLTSAVITNATTLVVKNIGELNAANKKAQPGDIIILQNGEWKNVVIRLDCNGTKEKPITFKAQNPGKVLITGNSKLKIGGNYIVVDGFYFTRGYSGDDAVITYRIDSRQLANDCRVTNTVINDFNNPKRMDENYWVAFYGKNNRLDHCGFIDKKNMGVLLAVILDDERSRENFHSITNNYFGRRPPLASNGGEIIRVGVSQHCQYNSNTHIGYNFFEHCDGETEIISIKSCANEVEGNVFKECQGSVVLRHGDNNIVAGNYFLGNDKPATGGVRVINKGQAVVSNIFYKCRGIDFRSPLAIMNGIPNSPAHRYVQVTDAQIMDNSFYECSPISLCEGSDTERTLPPSNVILGNNTFYNTRDSIIYKVYDDIKGIRFGKNTVSSNVKQDLVGGFEKVNLRPQKVLPQKEQSAIEYPSIDNISFTENEIRNSSGAAWFVKHPVSLEKKMISVNCTNAAEVYKQLERPEPVTIKLTGTEYSLSRPFLISKKVQFISDKSSTIKFNTGGLLSVFIISGNGNLELMNLSIDGKNIKTLNFISSDSSGYSDHYTLSIINCSIKKLDQANGCQNIFYALKSMIADSIIIRNNSFTDNKCNFLIMNEEKEDKGYYNAEKILIGHNNFTSQTGSLLDIYRGGNDESTLGPHLSFSHNKLSNYKTLAGDALIKLTGVQVSNIFSNNFSGCNSSGILITYKDIVRARHNFEKNKLIGSGNIEKNQFVTEVDNTIRQ